MRNDATETRASGGEDSPQELEGREGLEDFGYSPSWQKAGDPPTAPGPAPAAPPRPRPQLTLAQALDLLEVETAKRRVAEESVRESEERFRQMSRYLGKFLWLSDVATNKLIYVSPGYEQVWHTKREAAYTRAEDWLEETPPEEGASEGEPAAKAGDRRKTSTDYQAVGPDGSLRWIRERMYPIQDASGKALYTLGIAEDITDLKNLESAFEKDEVVKRAFLRLVPDMLFKVRGDGAILEFKAAKDDPELRPNVKPRGKNLNNLLPEPLARQIMHCLQRSLSTGRVQSLSLQYPVGGVLRDFEVRSVACGDDEVLALARDVTGRRRP